MSGEKIIHNICWINSWHKAWKGRNSFMSFNFVSQKVESRSRNAKVALSIPSRGEVRGAGISIIAGADIHIFVFTDCKNN
jgi:hypothetical protein